VSKNRLPPVAKRIPHVTVVHGERRVDDYYWLRNKSSAAVRAYLRAENAYTAAMMKPSAGLQKKLYKEMLARIKETDSAVPYREGAYFYYSRTEKGKQYRIFCRRRGSPDADETVILDVNRLAQGHKFYSVGAVEISPDGNLLAYSSDTSGFREYTLQLKDLRSGKSASTAFVYSIARRSRGARAAGSSMICSGDSTISQMSTMSTWAFVQNWHSFAADEVMITSSLIRRSSNPPG